MTSQQVVQTRITSQDAEQLDADLEVLGYRTRSDAIRAGLRLLHKQARYAALSADYDNFYGGEGVAPLSDLTAAGDQIAADTMTS
jgi:Arc/MetJ-type ribon-helix-helix transcriptional regulator